MASIIFIHALSKEATEERLKQDVFVNNSSDYIVISNPKITTNEVKHRIEKAITKNKDIYIITTVIT